MYLLSASTACLPQASETSYSGLDLAVPICWAFATWYKVERVKRSRVGVSRRFLENNSWHFHPAILSTCRIVHEEATGTLYGENVFQFEENGEVGNQECSIPEQCENIFKYNDEDWRQADWPTQLKDSAFARFLNRIGPRSAAGLKAVKFVGLSHDIGSYGFNLKANLLKRHLPGLIKFSVITRPILGLQLRQRYPAGAGHILIIPNRDMDLYRLHRILTELVRGCPSIEEFEYRGSGFETVADLETKPEYWGELLELLKERKKKKALYLETSQEEDESEN